MALTPEQELEKLRKDNAEMRRTLTLIRNEVDNLPFFTAGQFLQKAESALRSIRSLVHEVLLSVR